jgi:hypothetical protein
MCDALIARRMLKVALSATRRFLAAAGSAKFEGSCATLTGKSRIARRRHGGAVFFSGPD